jgi:hypothetical protein
MLMLRLMMLLRGGSHASAPLRAVDAPRSAHYFSLMPCCYLRRRRLMPLMPLMAREAMPLMQRRR